MGTRGGDLDRRACGALADDIGQIEDVGVVRHPGEAHTEALAGDAQTGEHGVGASGLVGRLVGDRLVREDRDELTQAPYAEDRDTRDERRLAGRALGDHDLLVARVGRRQDGREHSANGPDPAVEPQLADHHDLGEDPRIDPLGRAQHRAGDGQVESTAALGYGRRAEPHREFLLRPLPAGVDDRRPDPVAALGQALVGQSDQRESGDPGLEVGTDLDHHALDPDEGHGAGAREPHQATPRACSTTGAPRSGRRTPTTSMRTPPGGAPRVRAPSAPRGRAAAGP